MNKKVINDIIKHMAQRKKEYIVYTVIILLQVAVILFWAGQKANFFIDEFMTMGYTRGFTGLEPTSQYIVNSPEWTYNVWHVNSEFKTQLLMTDRTALWHLPFLDAIKALVTGRNYFGLLNIAESIMGFDSVSNIPAVVLNTVFFVIAEISFLSLMKKLSMSFWAKCLALSMFGFSSYFISMAIYVRFYMLVTMFHILMLNLFYRLWEDEKISFMLLHEVGIFAIAYFTLNDSELIGPYFACFSLFFIAALAITKKWKQLATYAGLCVIAFVYIAFFTVYLKAILNPEGNYGLIGAVILGINPEQASYISIYKEWILDLLSDHLFNHLRVFLLSVMSLTGYILWVFGRADKEKNDDNKLSVSKASIICLATWLILLCVAVYRNKGVLLSKAGLGITVLWIVYELFWNRIRIRKIKVGRQMKYIIVMCLASLAYTCFTALPNLRVWRYNYYFITTLIIAIWYFFDRILKREFMKPAVKGLQVILIVFTVIGAVTPLITRSIYYIYDEDRTFAETIKQHSDTDVIIYYRPTDGQFAQPVYDCINLMSDEARVLIIDEDNFSFEEIDYSKEFIFWDNQREDVSAFLSEISKRGYEIENLDKNHISQAYLCRINK